MGTELDFLQALTEDEFCELVLIPLLSAMGYCEIRYTHGTLEAGKDIVFARSDPLEGLQWLSAVVKRHPLSGSVASSRGIREVYYQVSQSLTEAFVSPTDGSAIQIDRVYVITPFEISQQAINSIRGELRQPGNRVLFLDGSSIVTHARRYAPSLLSSLPNPDLRHIASLLQRIASAIPLAQFGQTRNLNLSDIYTGGYLSPTERDVAADSSFALPEDATAHHTLASLTATHRFLVVLADVGSGKTTLLHKLVLDLAASVADTESNRLPDVVPLFVPLALLAGVEGDSLIQRISQYVRGDKSMASMQQKERNRYLLLLDGFDELPLDHKEMVDELQHLPELFSRGVVITSRPSCAPSLKSPYQYFRLNPFDEEDTAEFLGKWFGQQAGRAEEIMRRISSDETLQTFCRNPLMLTLYTVLASQRDAIELPTTRTEVYEGIVRLLLDEWDRGRGIVSQFSFEIKRSFLERLAGGNGVAGRTQEERGSISATVSSRQGFLTKRTLHECASELLQAAGVNATPSTLIGEITLRSSLLRSSLHGRVSFVHFSFLEFFHAAYLFRLGSTNFVERNLYDRSLHDTFRFFFGLRRTMDGISVQGSYGSVGFRWNSPGLALVDFLVEATYTSAERRREVFEIFVQDVLYSRIHLPERSMRFCRLFGSDVVDALAAEVARLNTKKSLGEGSRRYVMMLASIGTSKALAVLNRYRDRDLRHLSAFDRGEVAMVVVGNLANAGWAEYLNALIDPAEMRSKFERVRDGREIAKIVNDLIQRLEQVRQARRWADSAQIELARHSLHELSGQQDHND